MREINVMGLTVRRIGESTVLTDAPNYITVGVPKDGDGGPRIAFRGTWDDCDDYADRNDSPDNYERYYIAEVLS